MDDSDFEQQKNLTRQLVAMHNKVDGRRGYDQQEARDLVLNCIENKLVEFHLEDISLAKKMAKITTELIKKSGLKEEIFTLDEISRIFDYLSIHLDSYIKNSETVDELFYSDDMQDDFGMNAMVTDLKLVSHFYANLAVMRNYIFHLKTNGVNFDPTDFLEVVKLKLLAVENSVKLLDNPLEEESINVDDYIFYIHQSSYAGDALLKLAEQYKKFGHKDEAIKYGELCKVILTQKLTFQTLFEVTSPQLSNRQVLVVYRLDREHYEKLAKVFLLLADLVEEKSEKFNYAFNAFEYSTITTGTFLNDDNPQQDRTYRLVQSFQRTVDSYKTILDMLDDDYTNTHKIDLNQVSVKASSIASGQFDLRMLLNTFIGNYVVVQEFREGKSFKDKNFNALVEELYQITKNSITDEN